VSRRSDCPASADGAGGQDGGVVAWDGGVVLLEEDELKDGLRSSAGLSADGAGLPADEAGLPADEAELPAGAVFSWAGESLFADRALNQLFAAVAACRTAWRPLSSMPFGDPSALPGLAPSSGESDKLLDLPIPSAGNGTGCGLRVAVPSAAAEFTLSAAALPAALPASAVSAPELAEFSASSVTALASARGVPESDEPGGLVRGDDMTSLSAVASTVSSSGSISRPDGATIREGSVARPALSTPSSSVPKVPLCAFSRDYTTKGNLPLTPESPGPDPKRPRGFTCR
jgi:hypothetical protein